MRKSDFYREIEEIIEAKPGTVIGNTLLSELNGWDSLAIIVFIAMLDEKFDTVVNTDQLANCLTVDDLTALCNGKLTA